MYSLCYVIEERDNGMASKMKLFLFTTLSDRIDPAALI